MRPELTVQKLCAEAKRFAERESTVADQSLFGVTDGKRVGTYFEHKFQAFLSEKYVYEQGNSARGIDFPALNVDMKVTSHKQPQSSCPFKSAAQKIYGLGYGLLVFVYEKTDNPVAKMGTLNIVHTTFVSAERTADYQTTTGLSAILENDGNVDDVVAFLLDRRLPVDEIQAHQLAQRIIGERPQIGYLTISNALQWRLQYRRIIDQAGMVDGVVKVM